MSKPLTILAAGFCAALAVLASSPAALAQAGGKELSREQLNDLYRLCTFPVSNTNFSVKHVNDVIAACTTLVNTEGGSAENRALVHLQRGAMYRRLGKFELALADFTMSIHYDPNSAYAYTGRGNAHRGLHEIDEAIADHSKAIELKPDYAEAYNNRGNAWRDKKDNKRAIEDYDQALKLDPHYASGYYNRGNARLDDGDKAGAIADYRQALKINPNLEQASAMLRQLKAK
ncbi:MAG TPA: tetratricopeptide repeat protein [Pseudolabrys sp.]|nr:tetratricopeptide repeat protein [Pseudolabrys sp.]